VSAIPNVIISCITQVLARDNDNQNKPSLSPSILSTAFEIGLKKSETTMGIGYTDKFFSQY